MPQNALPKSNKVTPEAQVMNVTKAASRSAGLWLLELKLVNPFRIAPSKAKPASTVMRIFGKPKKNVTKTPAIKPRHILKIPHHRPAM